MTINVLFVCLGNICRSPTAHGVFEQLLAEKKLSELIAVDSAGTGDWHVGRAPDARSVQAALKQGYDLSHLRARQVSGEDFSRFDYILAMDEHNLADLQAMKPVGFQGELQLFLNYATLNCTTLNCATNDSTREVPDPYYGGHDGFEQVLQLVESASEGLLQHILKQHRL